MSKQSRARAAAETAKSAMPFPASNAFPANRWGTLLAGGFIVLAALAAYHNSFSGPFIYDDMGSITGNPTIWHLWPLSKALSPPAGQTVGGRPLLNLSLALNYALSGESVWSYHVLNLLIHILAGLALFGIVRRTLLEHPPSPHSAGSGLRRTGPTSSFGPFGKRRASEDRSNLLLRPIRQVQGYGGQVQPPTSKAIYPELSECGRGALTPQIVIPSAARNLPSSPATVLAFFVALLWTVHPLQTECVTYVIQRAESLMGLFYLLTLYCFVRSTEYRRQETGVRSQDIGDLRSEGGSVTSSALQSFSFSAFRWRLASALCCLLGAACKEVMVSAPLMVLLYDRTFVAGSFRAAWRQRRKYYFTLAGTWLLLGYLVIATGGRGTSAGFGLKVPWWSYALTQFRAIVRYLRLSFWPHPLVFYYGTTLATRPAEIIPYALIVLLLAIGTVFALWRRPAIGFLGCWFFAILAPSSSIVPVVTETMSEHRMYLA
ncbi:MAG: hypothetical protein ABSE59_11000, partial [Opitutaceae bacterium]